MKMGLALNNLQRLICHKTQTTKPTKINNACIIITQNMYIITQNKKKFKPTNGSNFHA